MITIKKKDNRLNSMRGFYKKKFFLFGFLILGSFFFGFVLFLVLYRFGVLTKLQSLLF